MINLELSDEQKALIELAKSFGEKEMAPVAAHYDQTMEYPMPVIKKAHEVGLMNTHIAQEFGGLGLGVLDGCLIAEELASFCSGIYTALEANGLAQAPLIVAGSDAQKKQFLEPMTQSAQLAAYACPHVAALSPCDPPQRAAHCISETRRCSLRCCMGPERKSSCANLAARHDYSIMSAHKPSASRIL